VPRRRRHSRKSVRIEARFDDVSHNIIKGRVKNISKGGAFIITKDPLKKGDDLRLSLNAVDLGKIIDIQARVVRVDPGRGMAVQFEDTTNKEIDLLLKALKRLYIGTMTVLNRISEKPQRPDSL